MAGLFLLALAIRCIGLLWGAANPDENMSYPVRVLSGQFKHPGDFYPPLYHYLNAIGIAVMLAVGRLIGVWPSMEAIKTQYFTDVTPFLFAIRLVTAATGALAAPLAAAIASRLRSGRLGSLTVGVLMAFFPVNVWLSHIAKNDVGLVTGELLAAWLALCILDDPGRRSSHLFFGAASALMVSFKQSGAFFLAPLWALLVLTLLFVNHRRWSDVLTDIVTWGVVGVLAWGPLNVGILLAPREYLKYQVLLSQLWTGQEGKWSTTAAVMAGRLSGATLIGLVLGVLSPLILRNTRVVLLWASTLIGLSILLYLGGRIETPRHLMPYTSLLFLLGAVSAVSLAQQRGPLVRAAGVASGLVLLAEVVSGTAEVGRQALAAPMKDRIETVLHRIAPSAEGVRILGGGTCGFRLHPEVAELELSRNDRLAQKYQVELPPRTSERDKYSSNSNRTDGYYMRPLPFGAGGMALVTDEELRQGRRTVTPLYWPVQPEEWHLDYWLKQGYTLFLMENEEFFLHCKVPAYERLYREVKDRGKLVERLATTRTLFDETPMMVYQVETPH